MLKSSVYNVCGFRQILVRARMKTVKVARGKIARALQRTSL